MWKFSGKVQFSHSFGDSPETLWKLYVFTKFPHDEIRSNYHILRDKYQQIIFFLFVLQIARLPKKGVNTFTYVFHSIDITECNDCGIDVDGDRFI